MARTPPFSKRLLWLAIALSLSLSLSLPCLCGDTCLGLSLLVCKLSVFLSLYFSIQLNVTLDPMLYLSVSISSREPMHSGQVDIGPKSQSPVSANQFPSTISITITVQAMIRNKISRHIQVNERIIIFRL